VSFHHRPIEDAYRALRTCANGLNQEAVARRLEQYGENRLPEERVDSLWLIFLHQFMSPLIYILLVAGGVAIYLDEAAGAIFIFLVLLVNAAIGTMQEYSAGNAAASLKHMSISSAKVMRGGHVREVDASQLVPGDVVLLESGCRVPADMRLIETNDAQVDESLLTGESHDVEKNAQAHCTEQATTGDQVTMAFAGTMVTRGRLRGVVVATGLNSKVGYIAQSIAQKSRVRSPLIIRMQRFTRQITFLVGLLIILIAATLYLRGHAWDYIFMLSIGIAVAAIPEGLPVTLTIALSIGMRRMAKRNVIVRKLPAVEALGSCTLIASDKTGTLTRNELTTERIVLPTGEHFIVTSGMSRTDGHVAAKEGA
jgi:Ca2+-transporting ATPase